ncbi:hypothetical protein ACK1W8_002194 [Salmonella enterica]|nr:hypothetical protein [Salmonella enterica subsp. enterica serovar Sandiego]EAM8423503.1 hypothetical protein [Salmonella enterica]ECH8208008.1 hypothetical protein [Salmonella enterica subsp. enterica]EAX7073780.1 hypothetical protein [Salmonella enterica]EBP2220958.1 hypothetical protein [Salmonella enterica]
MSNTVQERDVVLPFPGTQIPYTEHDTKFHGGDGGGGMSSDLEKRVERLEGDALIIKDKLTALSMRSEFFATKSDLAELKGELRSDLSQVKGEMKSDLAALETKLTVHMVQAINNSQNAILQKIDDRFTDIAEKTRWKWSGIIIPVGSVIVTAVVTFLIAKYVSH